MDNRNKISIVTVCLNSEKYILRTINSVANQIYSNIEHIIVDGGSTDQTLTIINNNKHSNIKIISESDNGIYDAMNKGFYLSNGDIIAFLNSDDEYIDCSIIFKVMSIFNENNCDFVYGDLQMIDQKSLVRRYWKTGTFSWSLLKPKQIPHPCFFIKRSIISSLKKPFDDNFKIAGDLKQQLELFSKYSLVGFYLREPLVKMQLGGESTAGLRSYYNGWKESVRAYNDTIGFGYIHATCKFISKINNFF